MRHHGLGTQPQQCGEQLLLPRSWHGADLQDTRLNPAERSCLDEMLELVSCAAEVEELVSVDEAELLAGPLGDGPVKVTGHAEQFTHWV
jgi:hypothetical protein